MSDRFYVSVNHLGDHDPIYELHDRNAPNSGLVAEFYSHWLHAKDIAERLCDELNHGITIAIVFNERMTALENRVDNLERPLRPPRSVPRPLMPRAKR